MANKTEILATGEFGDHWITYFHLLTCDEYFRHELTRLGSVATHDALVLVEQEGGAVLSK
jgi:hypothetical protein